MSFQYYVKVKGKTQGQFKAESKKEKRKDVWHEGLAFKMGSMVPVDANSGAPKGACQHEPLVITKEHGAASPQILQAHWNNEILDEVVIEIVGRSDDGKNEVVKERITLSDAVIVSVQRYSAALAKEKLDEDVDHLEDVSLRFRQIQVDNPEAGTSTSWNYNAPNR